MAWNDLTIGYQGAKQRGKAANARRKTEELAEKVVQLKPRDALVQSTLAELYAADKINDRALVRIRTSLALAPIDPNVLSNMGGYEYMGDREQASKYVEKSFAEVYALEDIRTVPRPAGVDCRFAIQAGRQIAKQAQGLQFVGAG